MVASWLKRFSRDEEGAVIAFVIVLFLIMFIASGMAIDFMRHETARADLQNALDRGVLAAADLEQTAQLQDGVDDYRIVSDFMKSRSFHPEAMTLAVRSPNIGPNARRIEADASYELKTYFLKLLGMPTMKVPATAVAEQALYDTEISLVLDISGSMNDPSSGGTGSKLGLLKDAAVIHFVNKVLIDDFTRARTAISVIPYNGQTALPQNLATKFQMTTHHGYSYCADWSASDFNQTNIPLDGSMTQSQHFWESNYRTNCPAAQGTILPYSNSNSALETHIRGLTGGGWTATYNGVKMAAALLDPAAQPVMTSLIGDGAVSGNFAGWPRAWHTRNVRKIVIIMTDGMNTKLKRIPDAIYATRTPAEWDAINGAPYDISHIDNEGSVTLDGFGDGDRRMHAICQALKDNGAIVYTVGFELGGIETRAAKALRKCGSSDANNYLAEGERIKAAFSEIAASINNLKLTN